MIKVLRERVPEFCPSIDKSIGFDEGEVLQHPIFGDFTRFVLAARDRRDTDLTARCLLFLDEALREGDAMVQNLVQVSFVENVGPFVGDAATFIETWPIATRSASRRQSRLSTRRRHAQCLRGFRSRTPCEAFALGNSGTP